MAKRFQVDTGGTLTTNLVAYFKMEDATENYVADGTLDMTNNGGVTFPAGKVNNGGQFTATSTQYLSHTDNATFSMGDIDCSFAAWVKLDSLGTTRSIVYKLTNAAGFPREYGLEYNSGGLFSFFVTNTSNNWDGLVQATTFGAASSGVWYFVVAWHNSVANTINIQINNGTVDSAAYSVGIRDGTAPFTIGSADNISVWDGMIDEVGVWKKVLSSTERTDLYNGGSGNTLVDSSKFLQLLGVGQ